ncbi:FAD:protein FMN transferase [Heliophilum fasciatum]|uniref:FAD:protein FMN transferase n=1 Tax=Heliophilum fasciatum TaxID=35700 RepID=A0A4R2RNS8_9FIRM|nr:FAD:protein FMN transferase [Heliophilum fasciatum]MCW2278212.1 thiamine biosynthesis lipoprotein [Heliophilum fasciatum]TCP63967.1 thiamine biosynthesis lipoprotein [Heliophilum fasciatum]
MNGIYPFKAMNTSFAIFGADDRLCWEIEVWIRTVEQTLSRFLADSDVTKYNEGKSTVDELSPIFREVWTEARRGFEDSGGLFNPYLGHRLIGEGYGVSFDELGQPSRAGQFAAGDPSIPSRSPHQPMVDFGGIAKGWSAQKAKEKFFPPVHPGACINAGGDLLLWGRDPDGEPWSVGIAHPQEPERDMAFLVLKGTVAVATSNTIKRSWQKADGTSAHHIIDPRTGRSLTSDWIQVTIVAPQLATAEIYAKTLLILGPDEGPRWMKAHQPELAYIAVDRQHKVMYSDNLGAYCLEYEVYQD